MKHFYSYLRIALASLLVALVILRTSSGQCPDGQCPPLVPVTMPTPLATYHRAIVKVGRFISGDSGPSQSGTGTVVAKSNGRWLVLTAAHIVEGAHGSCWVDFGTDGMHKARLLGAEHAPDLAIMAITNPPADMPVIPIAAEDEYPRAGESVEVVGYGSNQFRHYQAKVRGYTVKEEGQTDQLIVAFRPINGDSGGPVLYRGKLAGVLWGGPTDGMSSTSAYETHATCCIRIHKFLERFGIRLRSQPKAPEPVEQPATPVEPQVSLGESPEIKAIERIQELERKLDALAHQPSFWSIVGELLPSLGNLGLTASGFGFPVYLAFCLARSLWRRKRAVKPQPHLTLHDNTYVAYPVDILDKAWALAHQKLADNEPGTVQTLKRAAAIKNQILSGWGFTPTPPTT